MMDMRIEDKDHSPNKFQLVHMGIYWYRQNNNPRDRLLSNSMLCTGTTLDKHHLDLLLCTQDMSLYMHLRELHNLKKIYELIKKKNKHFIVRVLILRKLRRANFFVFRKTPTGTHRWGCINSGWHFYMKIKSFKHKNDSLSLLQVLFFFILAKRNAMWIAKVFVKLLTTLRCCWFISKIWFGKLNCS